MMNISLKKSIELYVFYVLFYQVAFLQKYTFMNFSYDTEQVLVYKHFKNKGESTRTTTKSVGFVYIAIFSNEQAFCSLVLVKT